MKTGTFLVASTPAWNEPADLLERCRRSVADVVDWHHVYQGGIRRLTGGPWATQAAMREYGRGEALRRARARRHVAAGVWLLQLDADEVLVHGERLRPLLESWTWGAFPLPLVQEDGAVTLAPFKLFRALRAKIVACSEYVRLPNGRGQGTTLYNLAGYMPAPDLRDALLDAYPFLLHTPGLRGPGIRAAARLSVEELSVESRPENAVQWPLPPLTLNGRDVMAQEDAGGSVIEYEAKDGDYACPGCGARYDTPGICTGHAEAGHEPIAVEPVKGAKAGDGDNPGDGPTVKELRAEASALGITGASKLPKDELAAAIADAKAAAPA